MRIFKNLVVNVAHTSFDVLKDKLAIGNLGLQHFLEFGALCQRIEFMLDTSPVRNPLFQRSLVSDTLYNSRSQTYDHVIKGLCQHTNSTAYVEIVFNTQLLIHCAQTSCLPVIIVKIHQSEKFQLRLTIP
jgi:hypothetical protein